MLICPDCNVSVDNKLDSCQNCGCPMNYILENQTDVSSKNSLLCSESNATLHNNEDYSECEHPTELTKSSLNITLNVCVLICPECGNNVATDVNWCPECGCPIEYIIENYNISFEFSASSDPNLLKKGSEDGNPEAMYWLAYCYYQGLNGFEEDEDIAKKWLKQSVELGFQKAVEDYDEWFDSVESDNSTYNQSENYPLKNLFSRYKSIIVVDTETSGLDYQNDRIIELAAVKLVCNNGVINVTDKIDKLIKLPNGVYLESKITDLTGITNDQLIKEGYDSHYVFENFTRLIDSDKVLIVAYNAQFDLSFLFHSLVREGMEYILKQVEMLDALTIFKDRREYPHKLQNAIEAYNLEGIVSNSHRAIDDTLALVEILKAMDNEYSDLDKYVNLFGYNPKYGINGKKISSVSYVPQPYNSFKKLYQ